MYLPLVDPPVDGGKVNTKLFGCLWYRQEVVGGDCDFRRLLSHANIFAHLGAVCQAPGEKLQGDFRAKRASKLFVLRSVIKI